MVKVVWSDLAIEDLKLIYDYIAKDSPHYANKMIDGILSRVYQLENFPNSGRIVPEFKDENLRELIINNYRIVYLVDENFVSISRVHHSAKYIG